MFALPRFQQLIFIICFGMLLTIICSCNINNGGNEPIATSKDLATDAPSNSDTSICQELIGIWHASPSIGAGFNNMFIFYKDNRFKLNYSQYDEEKRTIDISGKWTMNENKLVLSVEEKTVIIGGELVESSPSATSKYQIVNGTIQKKKINPPEIIGYIIGQAENAADSPYENKLLFNEECYWKISDNPDDEYYNPISSPSVNNLDEEAKGNLFFFKSDTLQITYSGSFMFEDVTKQEVKLNVIEIAKQKSGKLYELKLDFVEGIPDDRLSLGYFYVTNEKYLSWSRQKKILIC